MADASRGEVPMLERVRKALGRAASHPAASLAAPLLQVSSEDPQLLPQIFGRNLEKLAGKCYIVENISEVRALALSLLAGRTAVASNSPFLHECGVPSLANVQSGFSDRDVLCAACAQVDVGITGADYALADTGTFVMLSSSDEARLISLLPPAHIAIFPRNRLLSGLDELLQRAPRPSDLTSAMVLITGPSRTADIEQILVRGVHGPGEVHAIIVG